MLNKAELLTIDAYVEFIFKSGLSDRFAWAVRQDAALLEENNFWNWLKTKNTQGEIINSSIEHLFTPEMIETLRHLYKSSGVYSFWNQKCQALYIGTSINLSERIQSSFSERFKNYNRSIIFRYIKTKSASDACVLEAFFIAKYKPAMNGSLKFNDEVTIIIKDLPEFSNPIKCNTFKETKKKAKHILDGSCV